MKKDKIVQFVFFDTKLETDKFVSEWEQYSRSVDSDQDVTLQRSERNGIFRYIAQHRNVPAEVQFQFTKARRSSKIPEVEIKARQAGGYLLIQSEKENCHADESKVLAFFLRPTDLNAFRQLSVHGKLNIYEAYYENCAYSFVLEFFLKNKYVAELIEKLQPFEADEIGTYKECNLREALNRVH